MSTPGASQPPEGEKPEGFARVMRRVRTVLKRGKSKRASSIFGAGEVAGPSSKPEPSRETESKSSIPKTVSEDAPKPTPQRPVSSSGGSRQADPRSLEQREKAKRMFAKHGLTLEDHEWTISPREPAERIEKAIRMRVRYTCHRCQATFVAGNKMCINCSHHRCKGCERFPPRKSKDKKPAAAPAIEPTMLPSKPTKRRYDPLLTMPSRRGGQDLVRKPIKQRVRRTCHKCNTTFAAHATECGKCQHVRCTDCPRDPPKLKKYPSGYPGDAPGSSDEKQMAWKEARLRVRWTCHACSQICTENESKCTGCGHERCKDCPKEPPSKDQSPEPDPEVLKNVQEKLDALKVGLEEPGGAK